MPHIKDVVLWQKLTKTRSCLKIKCSWEVEPMKRVVGWHCNCRCPEVPSQKFWRNWASRRSKNFKSSELELKQISKLNQFPMNSHCAHQIAQVSGAIRSNCLSKLITSKFSVLIGLCERLVITTVKMEPLDLVYFGFSESDFHTSKAHSVSSNNRSSARFETSKEAPSLLFSFQLPTSSCQTKSISSLFIGF